jgi:hypothetical protein
LGVNPWDPTAPMGQTPPHAPAAPAPGYVGAGPHWPTPHAMAPAPEPDTQTLDDGQTLREAYEALARLTIPLAREKGALDAGTAEELRRALDEG